MTNIDAYKDKLIEFCINNDISELSVFGSSIRADFKCDSDIDLLYVFARDSRHGLFDVVRMKEELEKLLGRKVDFISKRGIERSRNTSRKSGILNSAKISYAA